MSGNVRSICFCFFCGLRKVVKVQSGGKVLTDLKKKQKQKGFKQPLYKKQSDLTIDILKDSSKAEEQKL